MRIRTIKPEFFLHDGLYEAEAEFHMPLRIAFAGLWCAADREGRFKWEARRLGVAILPYDGIEFARVLDALTTRGFVKKYRVSGVWYGLIPSFGRHQVINNRESVSSIPSISDADELTLEDQADLTRAPRVLHASKEEGKGKEGKGKEGVATADASSDEFKKQKPRNELLECLAGIGGDDLSQIVGSAWSAAQKRLTEIKQVCPHVTCEEIKRRAKNYKLHWPTMNISPHAIAMHWSKCDFAPEDGSRKEKGTAGWL